MKPTVGRIVLFRSESAERTGNGATEVPAIITRVWSEHCVNLQVFRDGSDPISLTSVSMAELDQPTNHHGTWRWMEYQKAVAAGEVQPAVHAG
jgi:hypothetical protein